MYAGSVTFVALFCSLQPAIMHYNSFPPAAGANYYLNSIRSQQQPSCALSSSNGAVPLLCVVFDFFSSSQTRARAPPPVAHAGRLGPIEQKLDQRRRKIIRSWTRSTCDSLSLDRDIDRSEFCFDDGSSSYYVRAGVVICHDSIDHFTVQFSLLIF